MSSGLLKALDNCRSLNVHYLYSSILCIIIKYQLDSKRFICMSNQILSHLRNFCGFRNSFMVAE